MHPQTCLFSTSSPPPLIMSIHPSRRSSVGTLINKAMPFPLIVTVVGDWNSFCLFVLYAVRGFGGNLFPLLFCFLFLYCWTVAFIETRFGCCIWRRFDLRSKRKLTWWSFFHLTFGETIFHLVDQWLTLCLFPSVAHFALCQRHLRNSDYGLLSSQTCLCR